MKRMKRMLIAAVLITAIMLGGTGCMMNPMFKSKGADARDLALAHMEDKYGEKFTYASGYGNSMSGTYQFFATCDSLPGQEVLVEVENYGSKDRIFRDNYMAVKYQEETVDFLRECAGNVGNVYYTVGKNGQSETLAADAGFADFLADGRAKHHAIVEVSEADFTGTEHWQRMAEQVAEACPNMDITVLVVESSVYGTRDWDGLCRIMSLETYVAMGKIYVNDGHMEIQWSGEV